MRELVGQIVRIKSEGCRPPDLDHCVFGQRSKPAPKPNRRHRGDALHISVERSQPLQISKLNKTHTIPISSGHNPKSLMHNEADMRTARQREASRINGARSRGPVTSIGKQKSSRNSRRHGLYAKDFPNALSSSHEAELSTVRDQAMHDELEALYPAPNSPNSEYERLLQCALDAHRDRMRIVFLEARIMTGEMDRQRLIHPEETEVSLAGLAFARLADETGTIDALYRLDGAIMRRQIRAQRRLDQWHRIQPVLSPEMPSQEIEICETNLTEAEIAKNEICGTNLTTHGTRHHTQPAITHPKPAYNRRVAIKGA